MALLARLQFGDNEAQRYPQEYLVTDFRCHFTRHHNQFHPDSDARCERVELTVVAPGKEDLTLQEWYITQSAMTGRVVVELTTIKASDVVTPKMLIFEDAYCFSLSEEYHINKNTRRTLKLSIIAEKIDVNDVHFTNLFTNK